NAWRGIARQHPAHHIAIALARAAIAGDQFPHAEPGVAIQKLNEALADRASCPKDSDIKRWIHGRCSFLLLAAQRTDRWRWRRAGRQAVRAHSTRPACESA